MKPPRWLAAVDRKLLVLGSGLGGLLVVIFILLLVVSNGAGPGKPRGEPTYIKATQRGGALAGELVFPGNDPYEPEFPFVRDQKTRYTLEDIKKLLPEPASLNVDALRKKRKERLEILYSAVD